jgi:hypothetical protein
MRNSGRLLLTAAASLAIVSAHPAAAETCLRMGVSATGSPSMWNNEEQARQSAIGAWPAAAREKAGPEYSSWELARGKNVTCALASKSTVRCTATAMPCKP